MTTTTQAKISFIETYYGFIPAGSNGHIISEYAESVKKQFYASKINSRKKLTVEERVDLKNAIKQCPKVPMFGQTIKIA